MNAITDLRERLEMWLAGYLASTDLAGLVVGVSGGIDSALCAKLGSIAAQKVGRTMTALSLPISYGGRTDGVDMSGFYNSHGIPSQTYDLSTLYHNFLGLLPIEDPVIRSNIRTRLRSAVLYTYANENKLLIIGTMNRVEFAIGYFQKHAALGDILPLARLSKATIREIAASYGLPDQLVQRKASGCVHGQNAEEEWGIPEEVVDQVVAANWEAHTLSHIEPSISARVQEMVERSRHKRIFPPIFPGEPDR